MQTEPFIAGFMVSCLGCFFSVNLHNILRVHKRAERAQSRAEVDRPSGIAVSIAAAGTFIYFVDALTYPFLVFTDLFSLVDNFPVYVEHNFVLYLQIPGLVLTGVGYSLFIWSVVARGRYAVSWEMPNSHKLVTWGPYHYVRHPSYLAYFLMFFGLFAVWPKLFNLIPLAAIYGYFRVTAQEEKLLTLRFGNDYVEYQKKTGRFIPRFSQHI
jgi:protein-S-isoprenylcysteine O-methyltransferase Ste14